ncbi:MAG: hypothetical protein ACI9GO_000951 [Bacteroidia bacterium]|jgi:hypothetical protein
MLRKLSVYFIVVTVLLILMFFAFIYAYGFEEGTFRSEILGEAVSYPFLWLTWPLRLVQNGIHDLFILPLWIANAFLQALVIYKIMFWIRGKK